MNMANICLKFSRFASLSMPQVKDFNPIFCASFSILVLIILPHLELISSIHFVASEYLPTQQGEERVIC